MKWERTDGICLNVARGSALVLLTLSSASQSCGRKHLEEEHSANSLQVGMMGYFLGVRGKSGDYIVGDEGWNPRSIELVKFFPYKVPGDPNVDEDIPEVVRLTPRRS